MAEHVEIKAEKAKSLSKPTKHIFMILLPLPLLLGLGIIGNMQGWIGGAKSEKTNEVGLDLKIPDAKVKDLKKDEKYDPTQKLGNDMQPVGGLGLSLDDNSDFNSRLIEGEQSNSTGIEANSKDDVDAFAKSIGASNLKNSSISAEDMRLTSQQRKNKMRIASQNQQSAYNRDVNRTVDKMYNNPVTDREEKLKKQE